MRAERVGDGPIVHVDDDPVLGGNVNGPSLVRAPGWLERPLGRYYLYFAHHRGDRIRLAVADALEGPWRLHRPGVLPLAESTCFDHVASPDVHVDEARREVRLYFHGPTKGANAEGEGLGPWAGLLTAQRSKLATSTDGLRFAARREILGAPYFRVFAHAGAWYALAMPGLLYRSPDGTSGWELGPALFGPTIRHAAVWVRGEVLHVFHSRAGDRPESILHAEVSLAGERPWEGAGEPLAASRRGAAPAPVRELRDPAVFAEGDAAWLVYAVAGEQGLGLARLHPSGSAARRRRGPYSAGGDRPIRTP